MPRSLVALLLLAFAQARQVFGMTMRLFRPYPCLAVPMFRFRRTGFQPGLRIISPKRGRRVPCPRADRDCDDQGRQAERGHGGPTATGAPCPRSACPRSDTQATVSAWAWHPAEASTRQLRVLYCPPFHEHHAIAQDGLAIDHRRYHVPYMDARKEGAPVR